jgi:hypothetical protein
VSNGGRKERTKNKPKESSYVEIPAKYYWNDNV